MNCELYAYSKDSGAFNRIATGTIGALKHEMALLTSSGKKDKRPHYLIYNEHGQLVSSTVSGGANPHTWGNDRDARKKGMGRKNINIRARPQV